MKILQINNCHYRRGGADVVYLNTGELLEKNGHEVFYFSQRDAKNHACKTEEYFVDAIDFFKKSRFKKVLSIPRFFYSTEAKQKIERLISDLKPDIAHIHTYKGTLTPSILQILKKRKIPVVITLHDYGFLCPHNSFIDGKDNVCTKCHDNANALYCILNKCNRNNLALSTISASEYFIHKLFFPFEKHFTHLIGVSKFITQLHSKNKSFINKITHLYNFYPDLKFTKPIHLKGTSFLFYGRLSNEKGIKTLLNSWLGLSDSIRLKIVGDGPLKATVIDFIESHKKNNIEYLGFKNKAQINQLFEDSSFIIVPSEWYENNPLTIIESYAHGKPVIGSNIGGIPEIIENNKTGYIFESGKTDALRICIEKANGLNEEDYIEMSKNARLFAEVNFSDILHYEALIDIYKKLL